MVVSRAEFSPDLPLHQARLIVEKSDFEQQVKAALRLMNICYGEIGEQPSYVGALRYMNRLPDGQAIITGLLQDALATRLIVTP